MGNVQSTITTPMPHFTTPIPHWWSTKPWCAATGLSEYEFRKYSPGLGRWISRDPIGEEAFLDIGASEKVKNLICRRKARNVSTLFVFVSNSPVIKHDVLGLVDDKCIKDCEDTYKADYSKCGKDLLTLKRPPHPIKWIHCVNIARGKSAACIQNCFDDIFK